MQHSQTKTLTNTTIKQIKVTCKVNKCTNNLYLYPKTLYFRYVRIQTYESNTTINNNAIFKSIT